MILLRQFSIRTKLLLLATTSAGVALLLAAIAVCINNAQVLSRSEVKQLESQARILSSNARAIPRIVTAATRLQEQAQDLLALSQLHHTFTPMRCSETASS